MWFKKKSPQKAFVEVKLEGDLAIYQVKPLDLRLLV